MSIVLYEHRAFRGRELPLVDSVDDLRHPSLDFNDITSSVRVRSGMWILYKDVDYKGRAFRVTEGDYDIGILKHEIGNDVISSVRKITGPSITLYEHKNFQGRTLTLNDSNPNLGRENFKNITSSVRVECGTWILYTDEEYRGQSYQVSEGKFDINMDTLKVYIGNDVIASVKKVTEFTLASLRDYSESRS